MKCEGDHVDLKSRTKSRPIIYDSPEDDRREEKPWQRVPSPYILLVLGYYLLLAYLTQLVEDEMPTPVQDPDVSVDSTSVFSEESAWRYLYAIMGDKPRVAGSEYHLRKTEDLKDLLDKLASDARLPVRTDWQLASGDYRLEYSAPMVNSYNNVSNIIALLEGESGVLPNGDLGSTVLLNCHYDSVPFALGASDNVAFCAIMVETLHRLSQRREKFKHNVIFLFNGAEENPLQGSHAFLQHQWAKGITTVVNLDAGGMNGKAALFQVSDPRVLRAYAGSTSRPSAQSFGEFLFASGIVPSDTDFRIWRDFGQIYGVDIVFYKWGNVYHTRNDRPELLQPGVIQCAGDMFLTLVTRLADNPELAEKATPQTAVYYDFLNSFMITYPLWASYIVDAAVAVIALLSVAFYVWVVGMRWSTVQGLIVAAGGRLLATVAGVLLTLATTFLMMATTTQLRYLSNQWIVVPLFWMPYVIGAFLTSQLFDALTSKKSGLSRALRSLQAAAATRLLLALALLAAASAARLATVRYVLAVPLLLTAVTAVVPLLLVRHFRVPAWQLLAAQLALSLPAAMFLLALSLRVSALLLPVMGRSTVARPDLVVALLTSGLAVLFTSVLSGTELLFSRRRAWLPAGAAAAAAALCMFLPLAPYDAAGAALQRHQWFHSEIVSYTTDPPTRTSGVLVSKLDRYNTASALQALRDSNLNYSVRTDFADDCATHVYCNLPLYRTRFTQFFADGLFINMPSPTAFATRPRLGLTGKLCEGTLCTLHFAMDGPAHNTITVWPRLNTALAAWSLSAPIVESFQLNKRPVYSVVEASATYREAFGTVEFWLAFQVPLSLQSEPIVDISHHAHKKQNPEEFSPEYRELLDAMPEYFNIDSSLTVRSNYAF